MNFLKKITAFMDNIPEGKDLSLRQQITLVLWGLTIMLLPFFRFPYGVFEKLAFYPLLAIALLNIDKWWNLCWHNKYLRYTAFAISAFIAWQIVSLPLTVGFCNISLAENILPAVHQTLTCGAWYIFIAACFLLPQQKLFKTFYWSLTVTLLYCFAYSIIESLYWLRVQWATDFLSKSIYFIHKDVGGSYGWWPPVFWSCPRLRSIFAEPSYFAILLTFAVLYYGACAWMSDKWQKFVGNISLILVAVLPLCAAQSAIGALALAVAVAVFAVLLAVFYRNLSSVQKTKGGLLALLLIIFTSLVIVNQHGGISAWLLSLNGTKPELVTTSSAKTRAIHLKAELKLIAQKPICGYGQGEYGKVMQQALLESPEKTEEIRLWSENEEYVPPPLNKYTSIVVESGIIGLMLFLSMFVPAFIGCIKCFKKIKKELWIFSAVICVNMAILFCTIAIDSLFQFCLLALPMQFFMYHAIRGTDNGISA